MTHYSLTSHTWSREDAHREDGRMGGRRMAWGPKVWQNDPQRCTPSLPLCYIPLPVLRCRSAEQLCQKFTRPWGSSVLQKEKEEVCDAVFCSTQQKQKGWLWEMNTDPTARCFLYRSLCQSVSTLPERFCLLAQTLSVPQSLLQMKAALAVLTESRRRSLSSSPSFSVSSLLFTPSSSLDGPLSPFLYKISIVGSPWILASGHLCATTPHLLPPCKKKVLSGDCQMLTLLIC